MSAIIIESSLVHYEVLGRGRPAILLHGWLGSWRYWVPTMDDLSDKCRTYAIDLWGFGDSDRRDDGYTMAGYSFLLRRFIDELGISQIPLIGHGLGGVVALRFAAETPGRVGQIMAVSTPLTSAGVDRSLAAFSGNGEEDVVRILGRRQAAAYPEVLMEASKTDAGAIVSSLDAIQENEPWQDLESLEIPVLLVYGQNDPLVTPPEQDLLERLRQSQRVISLPDSRHFPMLDEGNKFNRLLRQFLDTRTDLDSLVLKDEWRRRMR